MYEEYYSNLCVILTELLHEMLSARFSTPLQGPAHTDSMQYSMSLCLGKGIVRRSRGTLVDYNSCQTLGGKVDRHFGLEDLNDYGVNDALLILEMPFYNTEYVFTRWFQFMITDVDFRFKSSEYIERLISECLSPALHRR